ncbi:hypothetical protein POM88_046079 [Heracleum sosnowskyi]|uniref:START domain-containing protein n=1 Tax=Heracleum sosnowskyi TaxID=360622 RepID=A0AAD8M4C7_9APIA|nr:hypothetical protein POM88_046079 [Heracleum sosnowskyi]
MLWHAQIEMEQTNPQTQRQEAGPIGVGRSQKGGGNNHQAAAAVGWGGASAIGGAAAGCAVATGGANIGAANAVGSSSGCIAAAAAACATLGVGVAAGGGSSVGGSSAGAGGVAGGCCAAAMGSFGGAGAGGSSVGGAAVAGGCCAAAIVAVGGAGSGCDAGPSSQSARGRKRGNHYHPLQKITAMEAYFKDHSHPNQLQRNELAGNLGMDPSRVDFLFRAQTRSQSAHEENQALRYENGVLRALKQQYLDALNKNTCRQCTVGGSRQNNLKLENIRLREKTVLLKSKLESCMAGQNLQNTPITFWNPQNPSTSQIPAGNFPKTFVQNPQNFARISQNLAIAPLQIPQNLPVISQNPQDLPIISQNPQNVAVMSKPNNSNSYPVDQGLENASTSIASIGEGINLINAVVPTSDEFRKSLMELVVSSAEEVKVMAMAAERLWSSNSADGATGMLNEVEYHTMFPNNFGPTRLGYKCEASRDIARVSLHPSQLLNILMNVNEWAFTFSSIVSSARTLDVPSEGIDYHAALQVMAAEYHIPTPLVPNRSAYFARYCTQHSKGVWAVVDVSVDNILPTSKIMTCQKKPSGCVIQEMADGTSKITWIEHVYVDYSGVTTMYKRLLLSRLGFGAKRWVSILERQCQCLTTSMSPNDFPSTRDFNHRLMSNPEGRAGILQYAKRMMDSYFSGINGPKSSRWTTFPGNFGDDVRLMSKRVMGEPGLPSGTLLSVTTSFRLSLAPRMVFDFFSDHKSRKKWDIFSNGDDCEPVFHISCGEEAGNCVSMYKVQMRQGQTTLVLQESWSDPVASHVVFTTTVIGFLNSILGGVNPNALPLLPSGFTILPDGPLFRKEGSSGTLLTVSFQVVINKSPMSGIDLAAVAKVAQFFRRSCENIKRALSTAFAPNTIT